MKKITLSLSIISFVCMLPWSGSAQKNEWVEQVIVANGNKYEVTPPFDDYVTVQTYDPATGITSVFDEIKTQSVQDVVIANYKIYVAAKDSIVVYDANSLQRLAAVADSGLSRLFVFNNRLIVTKKQPIKRFFVEILDASNLSLIARVDNISGDCKGVVSTEDSIYIAVSGKLPETEGRLAVLNHTNWKLTREINFGTTAVGINDIYSYGGFIFCINETPHGGTDVGSITAYNIFSKTFTNYVIDFLVGNGNFGVKNSGIAGNMLYLTLDNGIGSFNLDTRMIADSVIFPDPGFLIHIIYSSYTTDYVNSYLCMNIGNGSTLGLNVTGTTAGDSVTSFQTGLNANAIALDYRVPVAIDDSKTDESIVLYPNPVENRLRIIYPGNSPVTGIIIRDITGRTIYQSHEPTFTGAWVDCSAYPSGLYFVTVKTDSGIISTKFIKK
ncbi:MAG: T9SS C-terminal target domain-containing protein [Bacteroidetes bacterium]|nr:MAG: T9SS C-terminal target domain-containing protein [Bacteroidota bacterium]